MPDDLYRNMTEQYDHRDALYDQYRGLSPRESEYLGFIGSGPFQWPAYKDTEHAAAIKQAYRDRNEAIARAKEKVVGAIPDPDHRFYAIPFAGRPPGYRDREDRERRARARLHQKPGYGYEFIP